MVGWRSPNLKTAGDAQPDVLKSLNYEYDISLPYSRDSATPWPFTLDFGYPYPCSIQPCPGASSSHPGFWQVMVKSFTDPTTGLPCGYVDGCRPQGEDAALEYLWFNFLQTYEAERAPFGLNMHGAWFAVPEYLRATEKFIERLLSLSNVYIINVKQMLDWMKTPVTLAEAKNFKPWGCSKNYFQPTTHASSGPSPLLSQLLKLPQGVKVPLKSDTSGRQGRVNMTQAGAWDPPAPERSNVPLSPLKSQPLYFHRLYYPGTTATRAPTPAHLQPESNAQKKRWS